MKEIPSADIWLRDAKSEAVAADCGMYLLHNGVVRKSAKALVRSGDESAPPVKKMLFSYDEDKVSAAVADTLELDGIKTVRVWLNSGELRVGDDIMYVLVGGDIRPHVTEALQYLVGRIKNDCVSETEVY